MKILLLDSEPFAGVIRAKFRDLPEYVTVVTQADLGHRDPHEFNDGFLGRLTQCAADEFGLVILGNCGGSGIVKGSYLRDELRARTIVVSDRTLTSQAQEIYRGMGFVRCLTRTVLCDQLPAEWIP